MCVWCVCICQDSFHLAEGKSLPNHAAISGGCAVALIARNEGLYFHAHGLFSLINVLLNRRSAGSPDAKILRIKRCSRGFSFHNFSFFYFNFYCAKHDSKSRITTPFSKICKYICARTVINRTKLIVFFLKNNKIVKKKKSIKIIVPEHEDVSP